MFVKGLRGAVVGAVYGFVVAIISLMLDQASENPMTQPILRFFFFGMIVGLNIIYGIAAVVRGKPVLATLFRLSIFWFVTGLAVYLIGGDFTGYIVGAAAIYIGAWIWQEN